MIALPLCHFCAHAQTHTPTRTHTHRALPFDLDLFELFPHVKVQTKHCWQDWNTADIAKLLEEIGRRREPPFIEVKNRDRVIPQVR